MVLRDERPGCDDHTGRRRPSDPAGQEPAVGRPRRPGAGPRAGHLNGAAGRAEAPARLPRLVALADQLSGADAAAPAAIAPPGRPAYSTRTCASPAVISPTTAACSKPWLRNRSSTASAASGAQATSKPPDVCGSVSNARCVSVTAAPSCTEPP
ncbi:hypothetical protein G6F63_013441 [Rhizopus arrhizus]|nr:hypothetical protein G6F63_013441 [Rhizopus arrhizus]